MRYYLIAGEASGDLHGANLMKGLLRHDPQAQFRFWGGDKMAAVGGAGNLARHYKTASFMGFVEVVMNLPTIPGQLRECKADVAAYAPDVLILIDYPGFNFKMAKFAHLAGIPTFYYISPKVWAWKESRVKLIRKYVDRLFIIFPFEVEYFRRRGIEAIYEGNPIEDVLVEQKRSIPSREAFLAENGLDDRPIVALLAGSRKTEIRYNLPFMAKLAAEFPGYQFVVGGVSWLDRSLYDAVLGGESPVKYVCDKTYPLLAHAEAAVVTSGTATLETALLGTPEFVCYRAGSVTIAIGRLLIRSIRYISLVNLIMDREVVREMIQGDMEVRHAAEELRAVLPGGAKHEKMLADYAALRERVGGPGASDRFAARMVTLLRERLASSETPKTE